MSVEKNHEQYLEQIEIAVAETTKELMNKHNGDLRAMAKVCAEKQVEINRLKEYQSDDRKTIRNLRKQLKEAVEESNLYQRDISRLVDDNKKLKDEIELQKDYIDALPESLKEKEYYLEQAYLDLNATEQGMDRIKKENEKLKEEHEGICSKYHADFCELEEKREENKKLKEEIRRNDHQACAHLREIAELKKKFVLPRTLNRHQQKMKALIIENEKLKEENKKHKEEEIEKVFGVSKEVFEKLMKECPPDPDDYK